MDYTGFCIMNPKTGEIVKKIERGDKFFTKEQREAHMNYAMGNEKYKHLVEYTQMFSPCKNFVWVNYSEGELYGKFVDPENPLKNYNIPRLLYLATFLNYDNVLVDNQKRSPQPMSRADIVKKMLIYDKTAYRFISEMSERGILYKEGDVWKLPERLFTRGKKSPNEIKSMGTQGVHRTRLYFDAMRAVYAHNNCEEHRELGNIFQLIPFIHCKTNAICFNPTEPDVKKIDFMKRVAITMKLGKVKCHSSRVFRELLKETFDYNGKTQQVLYPVAFNKIVVNPNLLHSGINWNEIRTQCGINQGNEDTVSFEEWEDRLE